MEAFLFEPEFIKFWNSGMPVLDLINHIVNNLKTALLNQHDKTSKLNR